MSDSQHIEWLNLVEKTGPFLAVGVLEEAFPQGLEKVETRKRQRVRSAYEEWRDAVDEADPQLDALHREWVRLVLEELLEYEPTVLKPTDQLPGSLSYCEPLTGSDVKPDFAVLSGDKARLLIARYPPDSNLSAPMAGEIWAASPIERMTSLCRATGVRVGLVTDGEQWTLVSVSADSGSSLGTWYARIWQQETVTLQAFVSLLEVRRCFGPAESNLDSLFLRSLEHQGEVADTLGEQVRRAVEVLVQALDRADQDRDRQLLKDVLPAQLYEAGLTVMMRLVVLLCAEERKLLLLGEPIYDQHYAVSTLRARLREDKERLGDEVLERRHDAWSRLLAVFRAVFGGIEHETVRLPALGGSLFDPDRFPFLEGRATGTSWRITPAVPLPIDNRTVLMLLTALQVLEQRTGALLLSYEALDVEQIGHVYEGLLERTVKRVPEATLGLIGSQKAVNPNVALSELEDAKSHGHDKLLTFLGEKTGRSDSGLKNALGRKVDEPLYHRILLACGSDLPLADRIKPFGHLLRTDSWGDPLAYREGAFVVALGAGRRETGTHYTPKSLTEPIVQHTLEPLVYVGPAEGGKPHAEWLLKSPREILALKVCDMAMGSAAFLVQTCRWLADRLVEAWDAAQKAGRAVSVEGDVLDQPGDTELLPHDQAERVLIARRLIASRCLYGVDKNPMAVELAKVSLWLITMMKGRPFSFLDHALKCGDSLLGVCTLKDIENFSLIPGERQFTFGTANLFRYVEQAGQKRRELEALPSNDHLQIETKNRLHIDAESATAKVKAVADCLIAFELLGLEGRAYANARETEAAQVQLWLQQDLEAASKTPNPNFPSLLFTHAQTRLCGRRPFHWPLEFPEVFAGNGFDAFVGNPPYMGGTRVSSTYGQDYLYYLVHRLPGSSGNSDLAAFFVGRVGELLKTSSSFGLVTTSAILAGDSFRAGPKRLMERGFITTRELARQQWPGQSANVAYVALLMRRCKDSGGLIDRPYALNTNADLCNRGSDVFGDGFILCEDDVANWKRQGSESLEVVMPYLGGAEFNNDPHVAPSRFIINFGEMTENEAKGFKDAYERVSRLVKPARQHVQQRDRRELWWLFATRAPAVTRYLAHHKRCLAVAQLSKHIAFAFVSRGTVFANTLLLILFDTRGHFAVLQSSLHAEWVFKWGGAMRTDTRYTSTDCFETFPFPKDIRALEAIGEQYFEHRRQVMLSNKQGLTKTYNRFHSRGEASSEITRLRALRVELDQAVASAYGWSDLALEHGFHETKQGVRYTLSESARGALLARLLELNHQRYAEEVKAGLHEKGTKKGKSKKATVAPEKDLFRGAP